MKQMFDISEKLTAKQSDEMYGVQLTGMILHGNIYLRSMMKKSSVSRMQRFSFFSDSVLCLGKMNENPQSNTVWEDKLMWFKSSPQNRALDTIDGEPLEFEWNIFPGFTTLQLCKRSPKVLVKNERRTRRSHRTDHLHVDVRRHLMAIHEEECELSSKLVSSSARRFSPGRWLFHGLVSEKKWYSIHESKAQGEWDRVEELMMTKFSESGHPVFPCHEYIVPRNAQKQRWWKLINTFQRWWGNDWNFSHNFSVNQFSIYGAVCEEYEACHVRTGRLVVAEHSDPIVCADKFVDENTYTFDRWFCAGR